MQLKHIPRIGVRYWVALMLASIFGANSGDFFSDTLRLGHLAGLPILAALFAVVIFLERLDSGEHKFYFWTAIIIVRTAATNMGDIGHDMRLNPLLVMSAWSMVLAGAVAVWQIYDLRKNQGRCTQNPRMFATSGMYWFVMFLAGTLGTVIGDYFSFALKLGNLNATLVLGAGVAFAFLLGRNGSQTKLAYYWLTLVLIRSAGTAAGDYLAHKAFGLPLSTLVSGLVFVTLLVLWREQSSSETLLQSKEGY